METKFWNNLIVGRLTEQKAAQYFRDRGFGVWEIGNFRLPVDLYVWNDEISFWVEVKFRTEAYWIQLNRNKILDIWEESSLPILLFTEHRNQFFLTHLWGVPTPEYENLFESFGLKKLNQLGTGCIYFDEKETLAFKISKYKEDLKVLERKIKRYEEEYETLLCSER